MFCTSNALLVSKRLDNKEAGTLGKSKLHIGLKVLNGWEPVGCIRLNVLRHGEEVLSLLKEIEP